MLSTLNGQGRQGCREVQHCRLVAYIYIYIYIYICICVHIDVGVTSAPKEVDFFALILLNRPRMNTTLAKITQRSTNKQLLLF